MLTVTHLLLITSLDLSIRMTRGAHLVTLVVHVFRKGQSAKECRKAKEIN